MDGPDGVRSRKRPVKPLSVNTSSSLGRGGGRTGEEEERGEPMSPAARLFREPNFNCHIVAIMGFAKRIDADVIKSGLESSLIRHPRFSSLQVVDGSGKPRWVRTKVALEKHVVVPDLDPNTIDSPDQFLEDYVSALSTTTLDFSKPLWDLHLLNLKTAEAEAVVVFRIHHSLGDGMSLMSLLLACTRKTSDPDSLPTLPQGSTRRRPSAASSKARGGSLIWSLLLAVLVMLRLVWNTAVDGLLFLATAIFLKDTETPVKGREGVEFNRKRFVHRTLSLEEIKSVRTAMDSTINDVLLGITSAGITRYLTRKYGEGYSGKKHLPRNIRMRSTVLVNIRSTPGIHAMADMMEEEDKGKNGYGNYLGYVILPFHITECSDPLEYVRTAKTIANRKKSSMEAIFSYTSANLIHNIFGIKAASFIAHRVLSNTTLSFSNVIGPDEQVSFYDHPLVFIAPSVYGHPQALTVHFQSYMDKVTIALAADEVAINDPHLLCEDFVESFGIIRDAVVTKNS